MTTVDVHCAVKFLLRYIWITSANASSRLDASSSTDAIEMKLHMWIELSGSRATRKVHNSGINIVGVVPLCPFSESHTFSVQMQ